MGHRKPSGLLTYFKYTNIFYSKNSNTFEKKLFLPKNSNTFDKNGQATPKNQKV